jgi:4'-phosphopantetheinyl transferase
VGDGRVHVWVAPAGDDQRSTARDLLLELTGALLDGTAELRHEPNGRPYVDGLAVSISHSRTLVAVAASAAGPVGVDVEDVYPREVAGLARRWFDPSELEWMARQPDELTAFLDLWTAKEAVGKALGLGLRTAGLRRRMPLPVHVLPGQVQRMRGDSLALHAGLVESAAELGLAVAHLPLDQRAVLAVALPATVADVLLTERHGAALQRTVRSRTSFPVVVRGT